MRDMDEMLPSLFKRREFLLKRDYLILPLLLLDVLVRRFKLSDRLFLRSDIAHHHHGLRIRDPYGLWL